MSQLVRMLLPDLNYATAESCPNISPLAYEALLQYVDGLELHVPYPTVKFS